MRFKFLKLSTFLNLTSISRKLLGIEVDLIIPEFPVRIGEIWEKLPELNKSFKID
jgi:hypothetical protein